MSLVAAAVAAARQQKPRLHPVAKTASAWFSADSLSACSQFWYDEAEYHPYDGEAYLWLPGKNHTHATLADAPALAITGDIDIRAKLYREIWGTGTDVCIVSKEASTNTRSYRFSVTSTGFLHVMLSPDGSNGSNIALSSQAIPFMNGQAGWVRVTWRQSDGRVQFFSSQNGIEWTQLGIDQSLSIASIYSSDSVLRLGARLSGAQDMFSGRVYRVSIQNGINGAVVADFTPETYLQNGWSLSAQNSAGAYPVIVENSRTPKYRAILGSSSSIDSSDPRVLAVKEPAHALFNGVVGESFSIPKSLFPLNVKQDFEVYFKVALNDISAASQGICNFFNYGTNNRAFSVALDNDRIRVWVSANGSTGYYNHLSTSISAAVGYKNNEFLEYKVSVRYFNSSLLFIFQVRVPGEAAWYDIGSAVAAVNTIYQAYDSNLLVGAQGNTNGVSAGVLKGRLAYVRFVQNGSTIANFAADNHEAWTNNGAVKLVGEHSLPYAYFPGTADNYLTTGSHVNLSSGPVFMWGWYPGVAGSTVISQHNSVAGGRSVAMNGVNNAIRIFWSADGTNQTTVDSPTAPTWWTAAPGPGGYIGALINPAAESITFYDGGQDPAINTNWTVLSSVTNITGLALYNNTDVPTFIGANTYGSYQIATGKIYRAGIGTSPSSLYDYARFDASTLQDWSVVQSSSGYRAAIITRSTVMFDGADDYVMYPSRDGIQPQSSSVTYGAIAKIGTQQSGSYNRFFSMEEGNGNFKAIFSMYAEPPLAVYSQLDDSSGGVSSSIAKSNTERNYVIAAKVDRQSNVQRLYVNGEESGTSSISSYGSITVNNNLYFGRVSFSSGSYMQGYQMYGFFVARRSMTTAELNQVGQALLPEAYS